ncbi:unnamed protein product, partial [Adineta ricciae]
WFTLNIISGIKLYFEFVSSDLIQYKSQLIQRYMSRMNNNQVPLQQQQQQQQAPPPPQLPLGSGGVYGGNQYNYQNGYQNGDNQYDHFYQTDDLIKIDSIIETGNLIKIDQEVVQTVPLQFQEEVDLDNGALHDLYD